MTTHHNLVANAEQTLHLDRMAQMRAQDLRIAACETHCAFLLFHHASKSQRLLLT